MKSLEKLKTVLADIEINEEQKEALDSFLKELYESLQEKAIKESEETVSELESQLEEAQEALAQASEFEGGEGWVAMEEAEAAFNKAMEDAESAFNKVQVDLLEEHSAGMTTALEDLYESLYEKATADVIASPQFEALQKIKDILGPQIALESNTDSLLKENQKLKESLRFIQEEKESMERDNIIESLLSELPSKESAIIRNYVEEAKSIDEIYERYNLAIGILEARSESDDDDDVLKTIDEPEVVEEDVTVPDDEPEVVVSEEVRSANANKEKRKKYTSFEEAIIAEVFSK